MAKKILLVDIDDTILKANVKDIGIWKEKNGKRIRLNTEEFAKDPDKEDPSVKYDYSEFDDPVLVRNSIINGTPLLKNLEIIDKYLNKGYDFAFLTARGCEDVIKETLYSFMRYKTPSGELKKLGNKFKKTLSYAINDEKYCEVMEGLRDFERKALVIKYVADIYDIVKFIDDDHRNVEAAKKLGLENVEVIQAQKD